MFKRLLSGFADASMFNARWSMPAKDPAVAHCNGLNRINAGNGKNSQSARTFSIGSLREYQGASPAKQSGTICSRRP